LACPAGSCLGAASTAIDSNQCIAGYVCAAVEANRQQSPCPAGSYCPAGSAVATACPVGRWSAGGTSSGALGSCAACTSTGYCLAPGSSAATSNPCAEGYYCTSFSGGSQQVLCPAGYYCGAGASGTPGGASGVPSGTGVVPCGSNTYSLGGATAITSAACVACAAGTASTAGSSSCTLVTLATWVGSTTAVAAGYSAGTGFGSCSNNPATFSASCGSPTTALAGLTPAPRSYATYASGKVSYAAGVFTFASGSLALLAGQPPTSGNTEATGSYIAFCSPTQGSNIAFSSPVLTINAQAVTAAPALRAYFGQFNVGNTFSPGQLAAATVAASPNTAWSTTPVSPGGSLSTGSNSALTFQGPSGTFDNKAGQVCVAVGALSSGGSWKINTAGVLFQATASCTVNGFYLTSPTCSPCSAGSYAVAPATACSPCAAGFYGSVGTPITAIGTPTAKTFYAAVGTLASGAQVWFSAGSTSAFTISGCGGANPTTLAGLVTGPIYACAPASGLFTISGTSDCAAVCDVTGTPVGMTVITSGGLGGATCSGVCPAGYFCPAGTTSSAPTASKCAAGYCVVSAVTYSVTGISTSTFTATNIGTLVAGTRLFFKTSGSILSISGAGCPVDAATLATTPTYVCSPGSGTFLISPSSTSCGVTCAVTVTALGTVTVSASVPVTAVATHAMSAPVGTLVAGTLLFFLPERQHHRAERRGNSGMPFQRGGYRGRRPVRGVSAGGLFHGVHLPHGGARHGDC